MTAPWLVEFVKAVDAHGRMWELVDRFVPDDVRVAAGLERLASTKPRDEPAGVVDDPALLEASMLLARVRYLHKPVPNVDDTPWKTCGSCGRVDLALSWVWPCDTARIVYSDEEIAKETAR